MTDMTSNELLQNGGAAGWLALATGLALAIYGVVVLVCGRERVRGLTLCFLSLLPLGIGFLGTQMAYRTIEEVVTATAGSADPREVAEGRRLAGASTYLGLYAGIPGLALGLVVLAFGRRSEAAAG